MSLQTRKQDFVRSAIWDAAIDLFNERGFDETTIEEIAQAAGVSRRSFFRYFSSKNDLMGQAIVTYGTLVTDAIDECPKSSNSMDVVRHTVLAVAQAGAAEPRTRRVIQIAACSPAAREAQLSRRTEAEDRVAEAYARRLKVSNRDQLMPRLLTGLTFAILDLTFRLWFARNDNDISVTATEVFAAMTRLVADDRTPAKRGKRE